MLRVLEQNGWRLKGVLNTHSNADHVGGNRYLQGQTGCKIFASDMEAAFTRHPLLEPTLLYGGYPYDLLRGKFLMAPESDAREMTGPGFPGELEIIPLPGHFLEMVGFRTPDQVVFLADCLVSAETLGKYGVTFLYDIGAQLETLDAVERMEAALFVPAHAPASADVKALARLNREQILRIADFLLALCQTPTGFEDILQKTFEAYRLTMNAMQHALVGSTVRSYLAWLKETGRLDVRFENNRMIWLRT